MSELFPGEDVIEGFSNRDELGSVRSWIGAKQRLVAAVEIPQTHDSHRNPAGLDGVEEDQIAFLQLFRDLQLVANLEWGGILVMSRSLS